MDETAPGYRILGIDPGLNITGYAVIESAAQGPDLIEAGVIRPKGKTTPERLLVLHTSLSEIVTQLQPSVLAVEQLYAHYAHPRTAILMGHARGVMLLVAAQAHLPAASYMPTRVKKTITGSGRASKEQMQRTIQRELMLQELPEPPDLADALALALCHYYLRCRRQHPG